MEYAVFHHDLEATISMNTKADTGSRIISKKGWDFDKEIIINRKNHCQWAWNNNEMQNDTLVFLNTFKTRRKGNAAAKAAGASIKAAAVKEATVKTTTAPVQAAAGKATTAQSAGTA